MEKSIIDSIFVQLQTVENPVLGVRRTVYFVCDNGDEGWTLTPDLMGAGKITKVAWLIEVHHPNQRVKIAVDSYPNAYLDANAILRKLGAKREIPIVADDWIIDLDGNLDCLQSSCISVT